MGDGWGREKKWRGRSTDRLIDGQACKDGGWAAPPWTDRHRVCSSSVGRDILDQDMGPLRTLRGHLLFKLHGRKGGGVGWKDSPRERAKKKSR